MDEKRLKLIDYFDSNDYFDLKISDHNVEPLHDLIFDDKVVGYHDRDAQFFGNVGMHYEILKDYDKAIIHLKIAVDKGDSDFLCNLGDAYEAVGDEENAKKYYLIGVDKGEQFCMFYMGVFCCKRKDFENALKYLKMAIDNPYDYPDDTDTPMMYFKMIINKHLIDCLPYLHNYVDIMDHDTKKRYYRSVNDIIELYGKLQPLINQADKDECCICLEKNYMVKFKCTHAVCFSCYPEIDTCPICRGEL